MAEGTVPRETSPPFLRLNPRIGWRLAPARPGEGAPFETGPIRLALKDGEPNPVDEPLGSFGGRTLPTGLAISSDGRLFLADPDRRLIWTAQGDLTADGFRPLWEARTLGVAVDGSPTVPDDPYALVRPTDVAIAPNGELVVVDPGAGRVLVMTWPTAQLRQVLASDAVAVAFDGSDRVYLAGPSGLARRDRHWRPDPNFSTSAADLDDPWALARPCGCCGPGDHGCRPSGRLAPVIHVIDANGLASFAETGHKVEVELDELCLSPGPIGLDKVPTWVDPAYPGHEPLRLKGLSIGSDGRHIGTGRPLLSVPRRASVPRSDEFFTQGFDGGRPGFPWDRLGLVAQLPRNTRMVVSTTTSDSPVEIDRIRALSDAAWSRPLSLERGDLGEVLIQSPPGRYLWIRIELFGDGRSTPQIDEIDIYGPRRSGLQHLPAVFHQEPESAWFLDRYLSYFDTVFAEITRINCDTAAVFDPWATPSEFLDWLGTWFDWDHAAVLPESTRRAMIVGAIPYFRQRGTVAGLRQVLQWHLSLDDRMPQIIEHFRLSAMHDHVEKESRAPVMIGGTVLEAGSLAHSFTVVLPAHTIADSDTRGRVRRLIAASIPAHTRFQIRPVEPGVTVAAQSTIGVDTLLGDLGPQGLGSARNDLTFTTSGPESPDITCGSTGAGRASRRSSRC